MENKKYANGGYSEDWYERGESTAKWFQNDREEYERVAYDEDRERRGSNCGCSDSGGNRPRNCERFRREAEIREREAREAFCESSERKKEALAYECEARKLWEEAEKYWDEYSKYNYKGIEYLAEAARLFDEGMECEARRNGNNGGNNNNCCHKCHKCNCNCCRK
ncbi:exosporium morphogenetic protein CdeM [Clostridioides difficile]|uniref:exosporium morphogenetic protein CdeM n=1 Tax=Clostridioides difficile TaxID=1496 RepID=UPI00038DA1A9|nr:exosporium morphogenetic protein CdeM [Clostridioides difficile]EGT4204481.1 exosporium morphogenetic protein CdeM [Clostridioides difficile]EGT5369401.1 exosporium morphogenetic protein CdeM [Clostridioides difficile]EII6751374.1 exosporium morphogenetic protein CdeM [Clostridioides difficile]EII6793209.1 exosporium morphogenetic protein CdeM [Clostridioides difficile]EQJ69794.1 hypothetical protein QSU_1596 [Clostridioides difficile P38]